MVNFPEDSFGNLPTADEAEQDSSAFKGLVHFVRRRAVLRGFPRSPACEAIPDRHHTIHAKALSFSRDSAIHGTTVFIGQSIALDRSFKQAS
jgi:hypothetical protein